MDGEAEKGGMTETVEYGLDVRHELVREEQYRLFSALQGFNDDLDRKATSLRQAGLFNVAFVIALGISGFAWAPLAVAAVFSVPIIILTTEILSPEDNKLPGVADWDTVNEYLLAPVESCFKQVLSDILAASETAEVVNKRKAHFVLWAGRLLDFQVIGILGILLSGIWEG